MKIVEFMKSLVLPRRMVRFKDMSALISVLIFVASVYLISFPYGKANAKAAAALKDEYPYFAIQKELDDSENLTKLQEIIDLGCAVNVNGQLECADEAKIISEDRMFKRVITFEEEGITKHINYIINYYPLDNPPTEIKAFSLEQYPYQENVEEYFVYMDRNVIFYQAFQDGLQAEELPVHNGIQLMPTATDLLDYKRYLPEFRLTETNPGRLGQTLINEVLKGDALFRESISTIYSFFTILVYPLLMILIFWLFFKRQGRLTRFREYYNIAAVSSIIPALLAFGLIWIFPQVFEYYIFGFAIYYLFILYRINSMPAEQI